MLGLPHSTQVKRPLPKTELYKRFDWTPSQRDSFDRDISRLDFVNWLSPRTLPGITIGSEVTEIFIVEVMLKSRDFNIKNIAILAKSIPQNIVYLLRYNEEIQLAVYHTKLFTTSWQSLSKVTLPLNCLSFDSVWESIVTSIGDFSLEDGKTLAEQIEKNEERTQLQRQITTLERQMNAAKQPRRKRELYQQLQKLKKQNQ